MNEDRIENLLVRYYNGELNAEEIAHVESWMYASDENRKTAKQIYYLCFASDALDAKQQVDTAAAFDRVCRRIRVNHWRTIFHRIERVAAVILLPLLGLTAWLAVQMGRDLNTMVEVRSTTGMVSCVTLPDNTRVWLNSDSYLSYPSRFGKERRVTLFGEGYFDVAKDADHKFVVEARSLEIEVYGTEFNVEAYDDNCIRTTLVSGRVGVRYDDRARRRQLVQMMPNQQAVYNTRTGLMYLDTVDVTCNTSWKEGKIVLNNTSLEDALRLIGNKYNVEFRIANSRLRNNKFTGKFSNQSLDVILRYFNISSNIQFRQLDAAQDEPDTSTGRTVFEVY